MNFERAGEDDELLEYATHGCWPVPDSQDCGERWLGLARIAGESEWTACVVPEPAPNPANHRLVFGDLSVSHVRAGRPALYTRTCAWNRVGDSIAPEGHRVRTLMNDNLLGESNASGRFTDVPELSNILGENVGASFFDFPQSRPTQLQGQMVSVLLSEVPADAWLVMHGRPALTHGDLRALITEEPERAHLGVVHQQGGLDDVAWASTLYDECEPRFLLFATLDTRAPSQAWDRALSELAELGLRPTPGRQCGR